MLIFQSLIIANYREDFNAVIREFIAVLPASDACNGLAKRRRLPRELPRVRLEKPVADAYTRMLTDLVLG